MKLHITRILLNQNPTIKKLPNNWNTKNPDMCSFFTYDILIDLYGLYLKYLIVYIAFDMRNFSWKEMITMWYKNVHVDGSNNTIDLYMMSYFLLFEYDYHWYMYFPFKLGVTGIQKRRLKRAKEYKISVEEVLMFHEEPALIWRRLIMHSNILQIDGIIDVSIRRVDKINLYQDSLERFEKDCSDVRKKYHDATHYIDKWPYSLIGESDKKGTLLEGLVRHFIIYDKTNRLSMWHTIADIIQYKLVHKKYIKNNLVLKDQVKNFEKVRNVIVPEDIKGITHPTYFRITHTFWCSKQKIRIKVHGLVPSLVNYNSPASSDCILNDNVSQMKHYLKGYRKFAPKVWEIKTFYIAWYLEAFNEKKLRYEYPWDNVKQWDSLSTEHDTANKSVPFWA